MEKPDFKNLTVLCWDNGLFSHVALKLAETFGHVYYGTPSVNAFPKSNLVLPGDGLAGIERITDFWKHKDDADLFVFPDVYFADMQEELIRQKKRVWGARWGENLELKRWETKAFLKKLNLPVSETHLIIGLSNVRAFLQERPGRWWIKTSRYRGDFETFDSEEYDLVKPKLDEVEFTLGMKAARYPFIIERHIKDIIELGYDGFTINGKFAETAILAKEEKDLGAIGLAKPYADLPESIKWVNEKLAERFHRYGYAGFWSSEVRTQIAEEREYVEPKPFRDFQVIANEGEKVPGTDFYAYLIDPCCRMASPPGELYIEWFSNWPEIIWHGSEGRLINPEPVAKYGVEIMLHSSFADKAWQPVRFPEEIRQWIKLRNWCRIDGVDCAVPQCVGLPEIGAVVAVHDDLRAAIGLALERANDVEGYFIEPKTEAVPKTIQKLKYAEEHGIPFSDQPLPDAETLEALQPTE